MTNNSGWKEKFDSLPVYYRSKFSQDCSRNETYEERNTEMIDRGQVKTLIAEAIEEARKEGARELGAYNLTCPYRPGNPNQNKLCDAWHRGVQDRQALIETALKEMSGESPKEEVER